MGRTQGFLPNSSESLRSPLGISVPNPDPSGIKSRSKILCNDRRGNIIDLQDMEKSTTITGIKPSPIKELTQTETVSWLKGATVQQAGCEDYEF